MIELKNKKYNTSSLLIIFLILSASFLVNHLFVTQKVFAATPAFVQSATNIIYSGTSVTATFGSNVTTGDLIAVGLRTTQNISSVTSTCVAGNLTITTPVNNGVYNHAMAYGVINTNGSCSVTLNISSAGVATIIAHEVSGIAISSPLDASNMSLSSYGSTATPSSGPITTTQNGDYIFAYEANNSGGTSISSAGSGFTLRLDNGAGEGTEDQIQNSAGSIAATFNMNTNAGTYVVGIMAFKPASGGVSPTPTPTPTPTPSPTPSPSPTPTPAQLPGNILSSGILAPARAIDWTKAGLPATLNNGEVTQNPWTPPTRTLCTTVNPSGKIDATDVNNINNAIASCPAGTYVLLAPGNFSISTSLFIYGHNNVTLRGSGPMRTTLLVTGNNVFINLGGSNGAGSGTLTANSNFSQGATSVKIGSVSGAVGALAVGNLAWFSQCDTGFSGSPCTGASVDNGGLYICGLDPACDLSGGSGSDRQSQVQMVRITQVTNNGDGTYTVGFSPGLYMPNWSFANTAQLSWQDANYVAQGNGLEDFTIKYQFGQNQYVGVGPAYASWVKGVRFVGRPAYRQLFAGLHSKNNLIMNNYFYTQDTASLNTFDTIAINNGLDSDDLILNNIIQGGISIEGSGSDEGDVIAYNYNRDHLTTYYQNTTFQHSRGSAFLLLEGNQVGVIEDDDIWGTHSLNTWFRNYVSCWDPPYIIPGGGNARALDIGSFARFNNIIGNALGSPLCNTYTSHSSNGVIYYLDSKNDSLAQTSAMKWGNYDTATLGVRWDASEVPTSLPGNAAPFSNPVPATRNLPPSFFINNVTAHSNGGTGLSWWKVCTSWNSFPGSCAAGLTPAFPAAGPDVTGGSNINGYAYDNPAALAYKYLPIDPAFQNSYTITGSSWSNGIETLTVSGLPNSSAHIMGGFQIIGSPACNSPVGSEFLMTGSTATSISYAVASNPGSCTTGTVKWPNVRMFDQAVYQIDSSGSPTPTPIPSPTPIAGDLNLDHIINALDYSLLNSKWNQNYSVYDLFIDGLINSFDYAVLKSNWGKTW